MILEQAMAINEMRQKWFLTRPYGHTDGRIGDASTLKMEKKKKFLHKKLNATFSTSLTTSFSFVAKKFFPYL